MSAKRILMVVLITLSLGACSGPGPGPKPPYAGIKLGRPYEVSGHWYEPHYDAHYDEIGTASWYGPGFHGGHTANGERFDQNALTAAHRTLPMPCIVRVTNLDNGLSAIIKVNDRGPFSHDRIIDLSRASAVKLGVIRTGTAKVRVQFLERETKEYVQNLQAGTQYAMGELKTVNPDEASTHEEARTNPDNTQAIPAAGEPVAPVTLIEKSVSPLPQEEKPVPAAGSDEFAVVDNEDMPQPALANKNSSTRAIGYFVQAGTFSRPENAESLSDKLLGSGDPEIMEVVLSGKKFYRVMVGPYEARKDAKNMLSKLASIGIPDAKIVHN